MASGSLSCKKIAPGKLPVLVVVFVMRPSDNSYVRRHIPRRDEELQKICVVYGTS